MENKVSAQYILIWLYCVLFISRICGAVQNEIEQHGKNFENVTDYFNSIFWADKISTDLKRNPGGFWNMLFFIGIAVSEIITRELDNYDPKEIVIDEWVGMWIALYLVPHSIFWGLVSFFLFRFFDIFKPGPVQIMDDIHSPIGVMLDDVVAGIITFLLMQSFTYYFS